MKQNLLFFVYTFFCDYCLFKVKIRFNKLFLFFSKNEVQEKGFSLLELVVVVSVLSILSSLAVPTFNCIQRKSKATVALATMRQIQKECEVNLSDKGIRGNYSLRNLKSYQIQSDGSNGCTGSSGTGLISAIPYDANTLPKFILNTNNNSLTYSFKGLAGTDFRICLKAICGYPDNSIEDMIMKNSDVVFEGSLVKKDCSAYALVKGSSWTEANENAKKLGGFLTTPNNLNENQFLNEAYADKLSVPDPNWGNGPRAGAWIGLSSDSEGNFNWANGDELDEGYESPYGAGQDSWIGEYHQSGQAGGFHLLMKDPSGHAQLHGGLNGWWQEPINPKEYYGLGDNDYWAYNYGIAEVSTCD